MKKLNIYKVFIFILIFLIFQCHANLPGRQACYERNYCDSSESDCVIGFYILDEIRNSNTPKSQLLYSINDNSTKTYIQEEPAEESSIAGDTFQNAIYSPLPFQYFNSAENITNLINIRRTGSINSPTDIDIYYFSLTPFNPDFFSLDISLSSTGAICNAYITTQRLSLKTAITSSSYISNYPLSSNSQNIILNKNNGNHLYIKCYGTDVASYQLDILHNFSEINSTPGNTFNNFLLASCIGLNDYCRRSCNETYKFYFF